MTGIEYSLSIQFESNYDFHVHLLFQLIMIQYLTPEEFF